MTGDVSGTVLGEADEFVGVLGTVVAERRAREHYGPEDHVTTGM
ncbi:hypothetical protein [Streptomyces eurythermus]